LNSTISNELTKYHYRGARALVLLHEKHLHQFLDTWKKAKALGVPLPQTDDPNYESFEMLLRHVLRWARGYMKWICEKLELADPEIKAVPEVDVIENEAESYVQHLLEQWRKPLTDVPEERFYKPEFTAPWKSNYCIDAMLEHAVMHPIRHDFQLKELMEETNTH
jgi:uncharacterized damage-inducible protein DinB